MTYDQRWHRSQIITGITLNSAATDVGTFMLPTGIAKFRPVKLTIFEASTSLGVSAATLGLFTASGGGGTTLVTAALLTTLTSASVCVDMTILAATNYQTATTLYLRNVLAHGSAATISAALSWDWLG